MMGSMALREYDKAVYSASKVEQAMAFCNWDFQINGKPLSKIT